MVDRTGGPADYTRPMEPFTREQRRSLLDAASDERILVLDGAMGTLIQQYQLTEADFRGTRFARSSA